MTSFREYNRAGVVLCLLGLVIPSAGRAAIRGLVEQSSGKNLALMVGASHGLPGIDIDVDNVTLMAEDPAYRYDVTALEEQAATVKDIATNLTLLSERAEDSGTLFFYFSGHGNVGLILAQDKTMKIGEIREAIESGRENLGPLSRLVLMFDSCYSGSLLDPVRDLFWIDHFKDARLANELFVDEVVREMTSVSRSSYWQKLFVFASSRADETSLAGEDGSVFTNAMKKAFDEVMKKDGTVGEFIAKTQKYTEGHHPVARLVPTALTNEKMKP